MVPNAPLVNHFVEKKHTADEIQWQVMDKATVPQRGGDLTHFLQRLECRWIERIDSITKELNSVEEWRGFITNINN